MTRGSHALIPIVLAVLAVGVAGCSKSRPPEKTPGVIKAAVVTDVGGIGDLSFNAMA